VQVGEVPAEVRLLGEHRQRGGAAALVGAHDVGAAGAFADGAGRGRAALVLGDQRRARPRQRLGERAALGHRTRLGLQLGERALALAPVQSLARRADQLFQADGHLACSR
jgi:hypothetical protein